MTVEKSELKALIAEGFAAEFFQAKEKVAQGVHRFAGLKEAFKKTEELLNLQSQQIRKTILEEGLPCDTSNPVEVGQYVIGQLMEVSRKVHKLMEDASVSGIRAEGGVLSFQKVVDRLSERAKSEREKVEMARRLAKEVSEGKHPMLSQTEIANTPGLRTKSLSLDKHPGPPLKSLRRQEKKEESKKKADAFPVQKKTRKRRKKEAGNSKEKEMKSVEETNAPNA